MNATARTDLHYAPLTEVAAEIRAGRLGPVELARHTLDRIERLDPQLHAYARTLPEQALAQAAAAEKLAARGEWLGPLHGVPVAVKDNCFTAGVVTANGQAIHAGFKPDHDATVVRKLREAGAILIGKLQLTEGAFGDHHETITPPVNPWSTALWTGVSSSGSGVATAAGLCFGSLGSDTGGSIRFPSAANGVTGVKPTWGRVSRHGVWAFAASMDHVGPMARSAADAALLLGVIAGADHDDPTASAQPVPDYTDARTADANGLRIGIDPAYATGDVDAVTAAALLAALQALRDAGASVREITLPDVAPLNEGWISFAGVEAAAAHEATFPAQKAQYGQALAGLIEHGHQVSGIALQKILMQRLAFRGAFEALFGEVDLVVMPVTPDAGLTVERMATLGTDMVGVLRHIRFTAPYDMSGHPTITLPCGQTQQGTPIGFQLVAPLMREDLLFRGAVAFQDATAWHLAHPPL